MNVAVYFMRLRVKALRDLERIANTVLQPQRHMHTQTSFWHACWFKNADRRAVFFFCTAVTCLCRAARLHFPINPPPQGFSYYSAEFRDLSHCVLKKGTLQYMHTPRLLIMQGYHDGIHFSSPPQSIESEWPIYMWIPPVALQPGSK